MPYRAVILPALWSSKHGGEDLPILYGLDNMQRHKALLEMDPTKQRLTFPGPGGYTITWSPGTVHIPLHTTPSGHLAFALDDYSNYDGDKKGLKDKQIVLHNAKQATDLKPAEASSGEASSSSHTKWVPHAHGVYKPKTVTKFQ